MVSRAIKLISVTIKVQYKFTSMTFMQKSLDGQNFLSLPHL
jgi:hypothetical protein